MSKNNRWMILLMVVSLASILVMTACGPSSPSQPNVAAPNGAATATQVQQVEAPAATATTASVATATATVAEATATPTAAATVTPLPPTDTPQPSATAALASAQEGFSAWCLPEQVLVSAASDPLNPPAKAEKGKIEKGAMEIRNMPFSVCLFLYSFNQPAPSGLKLELYEPKGNAPWWKTDLVPVDGHPNTVYARLRHTYIINPPLWNVSYVFAVRDANGNELRRDPVNLHRWNTGLCWQGTYPDPVTLYCPLQQDLHPWDPGYGKKLPTVTPKP